MEFADRRQADQDLRKHAATIADSIFAFAKETLAARAEEIAEAISVEGKGFTEVVRFPRTGQFLKIRLTLSKTASNRSVSDGVPRVSRRV